MSPHNATVPIFKRVCRWLAVLMIALPAIGAAQSLTPAPAKPNPESSPCGADLSPPILAKWAGTGADRGPLGCPVASEAATVTSREGTTGRQVDFPSGVIIWHGSGPRQGQTYLVTGCAYRLFFQYGGAGGWLGLPIGDATNTPDGQRQPFEGGRITFVRATDECDAEPIADSTAPPSAAAPAIATSPLDLFYDPERRDHITAAAAATVSRALAAHYTRVRGEAYVLTENPGRGGAPLKLFWNETLGSHLTTATPDGERDALSAGYVFEASQGFVWTDPHRETTPLKQFRDPGTGRYLLLANPATEADAQVQGFVFVRIEGYAPVAP